MKMTILSNAICRFNVILSKLPMAFFTKQYQKISHFIWKHKRPQTTKEVLRQKNGAGGISLPDFRLYYKATVIRTVWYWHKYRPMKQGRKGICLAVGLLGHMVVLFLVFSRISLPSPIVAEI